MRITGLGGGVGASRLWRLLAERADITVIVNTGEDLWHLGLRVCPDLDTTLYALSDRQDLERGWGLKGETFRVMDELRALGQEIWFNLGDRDLATHLLRTSLLRQGLGLAEITSVLARAMGVQPTVLPMTEDEVVTTVRTSEGEMHYEEYLVQHGCRPTPLGVRYAGADAASPAPGVLDSLRTADRIVIAPSNPYASIEPILSIPGVREALRERRDDVIAVSPTVSSIPIVDPGEQRRADSRHALLRMNGTEPTARGIAALYAPLINAFVLDPADGDQAADIRDLGVTPVTAPLLTHLGFSGERLLGALLSTGHPTLESTAPAMTATSATT